MTTSEHERVRLLLRTRQVREFTDEPLTSAELEALTDVARWSGSSRNNQPWRFIVIRDRAVIERIHVAGAPQTRSLRTAPQAIAIVLGARPRRPRRHLRRGPRRGAHAHRRRIARPRSGDQLGPAVRSSRGRRSARSATRSVRPDDDRGRTSIGGRAPSEVGAGRRATAGGRDGLRGALASGLIAPRLGRRERIGSMIAAGSPGRWIRARIVGWAGAPTSLGGGSGRTPSRRAGTWTSSIDIPSSTPSSPAGVDGSPSAATCTAARWRSGAHSPAGPAEHRRGGDPRLRRVRA